MPHGAAHISAAVAAAGFGTWNLDLILGAATESDDDWARTLDDVLTLEHPPPHLSAYGLTVEPGTPLAQGLDAIVAQDSSFDPKHFLSGARGAYEMIVLAFANGDRRALRDLLSSEVFESFDAVIKDREKHEQKTETRFVSIDKAELVGAEMRDRTAQLTVRFVSQMISVTRDKAGTIVDGNPDKVADITDVWTFARDTTSRDPNWKLVGTGSAQ